MELRNQGTLAVDLDSDTSYDQLQITGGMSLDGTNLQVTLGYTPAVGQQFTLIDNQSGSPINGTFTGLAEGSHIPGGHMCTSGSATSEATATTSF